MKRWLPHPVLTPVLAVIWLLLNNSVAPGQVLLGLFLGWAIPRFTLAYWPDPVRIRRPRVLLRLCAVFLYDVLIANLAVAKLILAGPGGLRPAFVTVPLALRGELGISLLANIICLTPGTVSAELTPDRSALIVHTLDTDDPEELVATIKDRYERPLLEVFEC
jgi:multicomponent K+:H+ antiporter subunit E